MRNGAAAPADAVLRLGVTYGPVMLAVLFSGLAIMIPYRLDRERHAGIAAALARRNGRSSPGRIASSR